MKISNVTIKSYKFIVYVICISILIYVVCSFIEFIRQVIFKFIYNLSISHKLRKSYYSFIKGLYIKDKKVFDK